MISRQELLDLAREFGLQPHVVEKDYALGWVLAAIGQHPATRDSWLFKGGTCLKKCYFETYRFSEDLDFTLRDAAHLDEPFLRKLFQELADWVHEQTGMELPPDARRVEVFDNGRGGRSAEGRIGYRGPIARGGDSPRIKLDLTDHEHVALPAVRRPVHHPYSDRPAGGIEVTTYAFEEVFAEKLRALAERLRPRDLYDVVHLHRRTELAPDREQLHAALRDKCTFKGIPVPTLDALQQSPLLAELRAGWSDMLAHQLPQLPPFESFWQELPAVFAWLMEGLRPAIPPTLFVPSAGRLDAAWRPPAMASSWASFGTRAPLEAIRFAAANRLCVELDYRNEQGARSSRVIEPYSLRRSAAGDILLMGVRADSGESRSYRVDRILDARVTQQVFTPRYAVELTDGGSMPVMALQSARPASFRQSTPRSIFAAPTARRPVRRGGGFGGSTSGPTYFFKCTVCGKTFRRSTYDATLNPHKGKTGFQCYGSVGSYVKTEY